VPDHEEPRSSVSRISNILGLDPGSRQAGYALARFEGDRLVDVSFGVWRVRSRKDRAVGLASLHEQVEEWLSSSRPDAAAIEGLFHHRNVRSALALAEARGVVLSLLGRHAIPVAEYPPATVKKTICGDGGADKAQVRLALVRTVPVLRRFQLDDIPADATDALAVAICHQMHARVQRLATGPSR